MSFLLGMFSGWITFTLIYISMSPYRKIWFTDYVSGFKAEILLLAIPVGLSSLSGTEMILIFGIGMSVALSLTEMLYSSIHKTFPSKERQNVYWFKNRYKVSVMKAINLCLNWEQSRAQK